MKQINPSLLFSIMLPAIVALTTGCQIATMADAEHEEWHVKILLQGDTQKIVDQARNDFLATMDAVLMDDVTKDADLVLQMGDIVESDGDNSDRPAQYATAQIGWRKLDGIIPYVLNLGNNDSSTEYLQYFPLSHYNIWPSFVDNHDDHRNVAHHFNAGGVYWLVISLEFNPSTANMNWAEDLIQNHPDKNVILINHEANTSSSVTTMGKKYENVVFVLAGHSGDSHNLLTGDHGNKIGYIKTCHHSAVKDSYFCVVELDIEAGIADCRYYSPLYGKYWDDPTAPYHDGLPEDSPWTWTGFDFGTPTLPPSGYPECASARGENTATGEIVD